MHARHLALIAYVIFLALMGGVEYAYPQYDWDQLAYAGCAMVLTERNPVTIHAAVYDQARRELPAYSFHELVELGEFRRDVARDPFHFVEQFPFYSARPIYVWALLLAHCAGFTYIGAMRIVSPLSCALLGLVLFLWARRYAGNVRAAFLGSVLLVSAPILAAACAGTPDALSALLLLTGLYYLFEKGWLLAGLVVLSLSLFCRTDNIIVLVVVLGYAVSNASLPYVRLQKYAALTLLAAAAVSIAAMNHYSGSYGYAMLLHNTYQAIPNPGEVLAGRWLEPYTILWSQQLPGDLTQASFTVLIFVGLLVALSSRLHARMRDALIITLVSLAIRVLLFPHIEDRYFLAAYAVVAISAIAAVANRSSRTHLHTTTAGAVASDAGAERGIS